MTLLMLSRDRSHHVVVPACLLALTFACTEPRRVEQQSPLPAPSLEARLELSDSIAAPGTVVLVTVRLVGGSARGGASIASATGRLVFDSTGLDFVREEPLADGVTRAINPMAGLVRFAVIAPQGLVDGRVHAVSFMVRKTTSLRALRLVVDEAHTLERADATAALMSRKP